MSFDRTLAPEDTLGAEAPSQVTPAAVGPIGSVVADRFEVLRYVAAGGFGEVFEARDRLDGARVALKRLRIAGRDDAVRARREVRALRLLRLPGVVRMRDEGVWGEHAFVAMDFVEGAPFPGTQPPLDEGTAVARVSALLHTLAQVHAAGVVHRDLKPGNILVDEGGRVTLLDFGMSAGSPVGAGITVEGSVLGTPAYMAPEQVEGTTATIASDLYAVGVMAFEALTGRLPFLGPDLRSQMLGRVTRPAPRVSTLRPELTPAVARTVDALLARRPENRPGHAGAALAMLSDRETPHGEFVDTLPLLGRERALESLVAAARAGASLELVGERGMGRTRLLAAWVTLLTAEGRDVLRCFRASAPFRSLGRIADCLADAPGLGIDEALARIAGDLRARLRAGLVVLADDVDQLDPWTIRTLGACADAGTVVAAGVEGAPFTVGGRVTLGALTPEDLLTLFPLPERILHLPSDAARLLHAHSGGVPGRVVAELQRWVALGFARWQGQSVHVDRAGLDRAMVRGAAPVVGSDGRLPDLDPGALELLAVAQLAGSDARAEVLGAAASGPRWQTEAHLDALAALGILEVVGDGSLRPVRHVAIDQVVDSVRREDIHRRLAAALPAGHSARLYHLLAAGEYDAVPEEALCCARRYASEGRLGAALATLQEATAALRGEVPTPARLGLLEAWVATAIAAGGAAALEEALYEVHRAGGQALPLESLARAALAGATSSVVQAMALADLIPAFHEPVLERCRQMVRINAARRVGGRAETDRLAEGRQWAVAVGTPEALAFADLWEGLYLYRETRFREASDLLAHAAQALPDRAARTYAAVMRASALLEDGQWAAAGEQAARAGDEAAELRLAQHELRATWIGRSARYRAGRIVEPDLELVSVAPKVGSPVLEALALTTEAAVAWRGGQLDLACRWADRAADVWRRSGAVDEADLSRALAIAAGAPAEDDEVRAIASRAVAARYALAGSQTLGLLRMRSPALVPASAIEQMLESLTPTARDRCSDVIAPIAGLR